MPDAPCPDSALEQRVGEIAERPEAVVDGDQHHAALRQPRPVVGDVGAVADGQPAAVDPDEHRGAVVRPRRRPDVQVEAVLVHAVDARVVERPHRGGQRVLHARRGRLRRVAHAVPRRRRLGGTPPQIAHRRGRERHAAVDHDLVAERRRRSRELPALDGHDPARVLARAGAAPATARQTTTNARPLANTLTVTFRNMESPLHDSNGDSGVGHRQRRRRVPARGILMVVPLDVKIRRGSSVNRSSCRTAVQEEDDDRPMDRSPGLVDADTPTGANLFTARDLDAAWTGGTALAFPGDRGSVSTREVAGGRSP